MRNKLFCVVADNEVDKPLTVLLHVMRSVKSCFSNSRLATPFILLKLSQERGLALTVISPLETPASADLCP